MRPMTLCYCCGRPVFSPTRMGDGHPVHFNCWDEHHSDPTTEWPPGHVCAGATEGDQ